MKASVLAWISMSMPKPFAVPDLVFWLVSAVMRVARLVEKLASWKVDMLESQKVGMSESRKVGKLVYLFP